MLVTKCDVCNKEIKNKAVFASIGGSLFSNHKALCLKCGKPVANFLEKINNKKNGKIKKTKNNY